MIVRTIKIQNNSRLHLNGDAVIGELGLQFGQFCILKPLVYIDGNAGGLDDICMRHDQTSFVLSVENLGFTVVFLAKIVNLHLS